MTITAPDALDEVRRLLRASALPTSDLDTADPADFRIAARGGHLLGVVAVESYGRDGLLRSLAVAADARGAGLGAQLVDAAEALARDRGLRSLTLLTTTASSFFESRGYSVCDRADAPEAVRQSSEFQSVCPSSATCMGKALSPSA